jgi:2-oxoglutarate dehydrogenase E2 component (dihydrolipoamide succinyltransferase)
MANEVVMPQMGESIAEGTIVRWIKKVGDKVDRDEPLFEISTDKVDAEIPSPAAGVVTEIRVKEGETVPVNSVVALIGEAGEARATTAASAPPPAPAAPPAPSPQADGSTAPSPRPEAPAKAGSTEEAIRQRSSPVVRKIAQEHGVDISQIQGSGIAGRVTKNDILAYVEGGQAARPAQAPSAPAAAPKGPAIEMPSFKPGANDEVVPLTVMRKKIAEHMVMSRRTSAHVHSVFQVNFGRIDEIRRAKKAEYERAGAKLTYMAFILKAAVDALRAVPVVNASTDGENVIYHRDVNIGVAVALDWGLIVPVIKKADEKNLLGLGRSVVDLANRARSKQLKPDEVQGGTFTITNPGVFGAEFGMPIINQPQLAIMGVGAVEKRVVVVNDAIMIKPMAYLTLGYDHRLIDGAVADQFMSHVKNSLENWDPNQA